MRSRGRVSTAIICPHMLWDHSRIEDGCFQEIPVILDMFRMVIKIRLAIGGAKVWDRVNKAWLLARLTNRILIYAVLWIRLLCWSLFVLIWAPWTCEWVTSHWFHPNQGQRNCSLVSTSQLYHLRASSQHKPILLAENTSVGTTRS